MPSKQCTCGRSAVYPYCDGTHKIKNNDPEPQPEKKEKVV